ncbi:MAG TPA: hypothetical protein PKW17_12875 [Smithellaceae bacterium]|nr:hypothetical protein [Smithellaceae bacterium]HRS90339.1 hypothetical protein [Smithellaceae bacterium]
MAETITHYKDQIVTVKDMDEDARQLFTENYKGQDPGIIKADFNGDGKEDVAILTKGALLFFICKKQCKEIKLRRVRRFSIYHSDTKRRPDRRVRRI